MWYGMDDDDTGTRADNPILVVAESVAMVSRMPLADLQVRRPAEIIATESDEKAGVETSVETLPGFPRIWPCRAADRVWCGRLDGTRSH